MTVHNEWWRSGFNNKMYTFPNTETKYSDEWHFEFDRCTQQPEDFYNECLRSASLIRDEHGSKIKVLLSGGKDSEVVANAFLDQGIPITCHTFKFIDGENNRELNAFDTKWAVEFCEAKGIPHEMQDVDLYRWCMDSNYWSRFQKYERANGFGEWMWMIENAAEDGSAVVGGHGMMFEYLWKLPPNTELEENSRGCESNYHSTIYKQSQVDTKGAVPTRWYVSICERDGDTVENFLHINNIAGTFKFFGYTPEIVYSILSDSIVDELVKHERPGINHLAGLKTEFYQKYFDVRDRPKYSGYELIYDWQPYQDFVLNKRETFNWEDTVVQRMYYEDFLDKLRYQG